MRRRRAARLAVRDPHPDPRIEAQLQQILPLLAAARGNEEMLAGVRADYSRVSAVASKHPNWDGHDKRLKQIGHLADEIARLNAETAALHVRAQELCSGISDNDIVYLGAR